MAELLLLSNSRAPGQAFLEHAADAIRSILGDRARILFVPFASGRRAILAGASTGRLFRRGVPPTCRPAPTCHSCSIPRRASTRVHGPVSHNPLLAQRLRTATAAAGYALSGPCSCRRHRCAATRRPGTWRSPPPRWRSGWNRCTARCSTARSTSSSPGPCSMTSPGPTAHRSKASRSDWPRRSSSLRPCSPSTCS